MQRSRCLLPRSRKPAAADRGLRCAGWGWPACPLAKARGRLICKLAKADARVHVRARTRQAADVRVHAEIKEGKVTERACACGRAPNRPRMCECVPDSK